MTAAAWIGFLAAASVGAAARFLVDGWIEDRAGDQFPWGTLAVNVTGCLVLGVLTGLARSHGLAGTPRTVVGTGGIGAYTTFSTFTFETVRLVEEGDWKYALGNVMASMFLGLAAAAVGIAIVSL